MQFRAMQFQLRCNPKPCNPRIAIQAMQYASVNSPPCNANEGNCSTFQATQFEAVQFQAMQPQARCNPKHCNPSDAIHIRCNPNAKQPKTLQSQSDAVQSIANAKQCRCNQSNAMRTSAPATCQSNVPSKMQPQDNAGRSLPITFGKMHVKCMGHVVGSGELSVDRDKVAAIAD